MISLPGYIIPRIYRTGVVRSAKGDTGAFRQSEPYGVCQCLIVELCDEAIGEVEPKFANINEIHRFHPLAVPSSFFRLRSADACQSAIWEKTADRVRVRSRRIPIISPGFRLTTIRFR